MLQNVYFLDKHVGVYLLLALERVFTHTSNTKGATCDEGSDYDSEAHEITPGFWCN